MKALALAIMIAVVGDAVLDHGAMVVAAVHFAQICADNFVASFKASLFAA